MNCSISLRPLALSLLFSSTMMGAIISNDFSSDAPGAKPAGATVSGGLEAIMVVDGQTSPADPFGPAGNQSLLIRKTLVDDPVPRATWSFDAVKSGVFTVTACQDSTSPNPLLSIYLLQDNLTNVAVSVSITGTTVAILDGEKNRYITAPLVVESPYEVAIHFFENQTFSVCVNGKILDASGKTAFSFSHPVSEINAIQFATADRQRSDSRVFVNHFELAEPMNSDR